MATEREAFADWYRVHAFQAGDRRGWEGVGWAAWEARAALAAPPVEQQARELTYSSTQATECAGCGVRKHTPLRIDAMGGYVCLTCIDNKLGSMLGEFGHPDPAQPAPQAGAAEPIALTVDLPELVVDVVAGQANLSGPFSERFYWFAQLLKDEVIARLPRHCFYPTAHPTEQPYRAVMQQALEALQTLYSMQSEWHADFPQHVGDKEVPAMQAASAAIAALTATMEKP